MDIGYYYSVNPEKTQRKKNEFEEEHVHTVLKNNFNMKKTTFRIFERKIIPWITTKNKT